MAYDQNIPQSTDLLSQSQADIQQNFAAIQTFIEVNHDTFASATEGKHKFVSLPQGTVSGTFPLETTATELGLYCKTDGANPALYLRPPSQAVGVTTDDINIMYSINAASGETILPSGIKMKWGTGTINAGSNTSGAITYYSAFTTALYSLQISPYGSRATGAAQDYVLNVWEQGLANFKVTRTNAYIGTASTFYYLAIGI